MNDACAPANCSWVSNLMPRAWLRRWLMMRMMCAIVIVIILAAAACGSGSGRSSCRQNVNFVFISGICGISGCLDDSVAHAARRCWTASNRAALHEININRSNAFKPHLDDLPALSRRFFISQPLCALCLLCDFYLLFCGRAVIKMPLAICNH